MLNFVHHIIMMCVNKYGVNVEHRLDILKIKAGLIKLILMFGFSGILGTV